LSLGKNIEKERVKANLSIEELAKRSNVNSRSVWGYCKGAVTSLRTEYLDAFAKEMNIDPFLFLESINKNDFSFRAHAPKLNYDNVLWVKITNSMAFKENLLRFLELKFMSILDLSFKTSIPPGSFNGFFYAKKLRRNIVVKIAKALNVTPAKLLDGAASW
jgi:transcriptional regulator with XRE-family HTH domain